MLRIRAQFEQPIAAELRNLVEILSSIQERSGSKKRFLFPREDEVDGQINFRTLLSPTITYQGEIVKATDRRLRQILAKFSGNARDTVTLTGTRRPQQQTNDSFSSADTPAVSMHLERPGVMRSQNISQVKGRLIHPSTDHSFRIPIWFPGQGYADSGSTAEIFRKTKKGLLEIAHVMFTKFAKLSEGAIIDMYRNLFTFLRLKLANYKDSNPEWICSLSPKLKYAHFTPPWFRHKVVMRTTNGSVSECIPIISIVENERSLQSQISEA